MSCSPLASAYIAQIRNRFRQHVQTGIDLTPEQVYWLVSNLNSAHALAIEQEDDLSILQRASRRPPGSMPVAVPSLGPNIMRLPFKTRVPIVGGSDGGDAA